MPLKKNGKITNRLLESVVCWSVFDSVLYSASRFERHGSGVVGRERRRRTSAYCRYIRLPYLSQLYYCSNNVDTFTRALLWTLYICVPGIFMLVVVVFAWIRSVPVCPVVLRYRRAPWLFWEHSTRIELLELVQQCCRSKGRVPIQLQVSIFLIKSSMIFSKLH